MAVFAVQAGMTRHPGDPRRPASRPSRSFRGAMSDLHCGHSEVRRRQGTRNIVSWSGFRSRAMPLSDLGHTAGSCWSSKGCARSGAFNQVKQLSSGAHFILAASIERASRSRQLTRISMAKQNQVWMRHAWSRAPDGSNRDTDADTCGGVAPGSDVSSRGPAPVRRSGKPHRR